MKRIKRYFKIILGSLIIAVTLNLFFKSNNILPSGIFGLGMLYSYKTGIPLSLSILLLNLIFMGLSMAIMNGKYLKKEYITFFLIPLFIFLTRNINTLIDLGDVDRLLIAIYGGALVGVGSMLIYHENSYMCGTNVLNLIDKLNFKREDPVTTYLLDGFMMLLVYRYFGISSVLYSIVAIVIMEYIGRQIMIGVHDSKVFYIITKKEKEVKDYILEDLKCDITEFDVKGGFSKNQNKIIMTVIPTDSYYKLREGIREIDPNAFISITESYEVINDNIAISK